MLKKYYTAIVIALVALLSLGTGLFLGTTQSRIQDLVDQTINLSGNTSGVTAPDFKLFWEVWQKVKQESIVQNINDQDLFYGAIRGIVGSLKDPYSIFLTPVETKKFNEELSGSFEGIGAEIGFNKNKILSIIAPLPGTPAERAGLKAGDMIFKINSEETGNMSLDEAVSKIRGTKGTQVILSIFREGDSEPKDYTITRDKIAIESVKWEMKKSGEKDVAYVKISHFNGDTADKFAKFVLPIMQKNPQGIILDLRNNPGGFLDASVRIASHWVGSDVVVIEQEKGDKRTPLNGGGIARFGDIPTIILVNGGSASASEIVAGALQDHGKAKLVGEKTFGKGSVQELQSLSDGSTVKLTIAKWLTPKGTSISDKGITPDVEVKITDKDFEVKLDPQLDKALELLGK
ncbi:hypothetical protein A2841_01980 [Candidatus Kaiserbacteria bacterium RIFCSPHIGHO2_01_FULL_48_10]|uniref:PDZ domain-containing protein n=1 Tax=Candidatus Kaiserbacteria bacterium RIFCSPHIGHO2_01_FULL_48_10 TaxID=1798476 RepID=A0A1F6C6G3_9BACT|nr:MAG: hypothetical protein A2841_01980 [Candidatus Kaiserbacteria bacterium RIFCSPHIGHO2_01_FULL_48_10]HLD00027.1 S41 family peptidase [Patescibacteria group bacterium]